MNDDFVDLEQEQQEEQEVRQDAAVQGQAAAAQVPPAPVVMIHNEMHDVLSQVVGLSDHQINALSNEDVVTLRDLVLIEQDDLLALFNEDDDTLRLRVKQQSRLKAFMEWALYQEQVKGVQNIRDIVQEFNIQICEEWQRQLSTKRKHADDRSIKGKKDSVKEPEVFTGKMQTWLKAKREMKAYLSQREGVNGIPLIYVIWNEQDDQEADHTSPVVTMISNARHEGSDFQKDNFIVFSILQTWTTGSNASDYIDQYDLNKDGRGAWLHLVAQMEGGDAKNVMARNANRIIQESYFSHETRNFTAEDYCNKHIRANLQLRQAGHGKQKHEEVTEFIDHIDQSLAYIKADIRKDPQANNDIFAACRLFKELYELTKPLSAARTGRGQERSVGGMSSRGGRGRGGSGRSGRNGPRSQGRGGRGGGRQGFRGSRGGRGDTRGGRTGMFLDNSVLNQMTPAQRKAFYAGRELLQSQQGNEQAQSQVRSVSAVQQQPTPSTTTSETQATVPTSSSNNDAASQQFGRAGRRLQGALTVTNRKSINRVSIIAESQTNRQESRDMDRFYRFEIDSRADTTCCGRGWRVQSYTGQVVDVNGFHDSFETIKNVPIATCYASYDHPDGNTYIIVVNEALFFGDSMEHSLLPPAQVWNNGLVCDITPKHCTQGNSLFGIYDKEQDIHLPFELTGCIAHISIRRSMHHEYLNCKQITLTSEEQWDPYSDIFKQQEQPYMRNNQRIEDDYLYATYDFHGNRIIRATSSSDHRSSVTAEQLARRWGTSVTVAQNTLKVTTQRGVRFVTKENLSRRFRTRQAQLQYRHLRTNVFSDTMFSEVKSIRSNTCAQVFVTDETYSRVYPMKTKADAFVALNSFVQSVGIPKMLITDNAREEYDAEWERVRKKYLIHQRVTEPYSPWQNKAELEIRELKGHFRRVMYKTQAPERLWCYCFEYVSDIRSFTARPRLDDRTPYENLTGETPDISEYIEFEFHGWVKWWDPQVGEQLGRWLGVAKNQGPAMVYWILQENCKVISRSTVRILRKEEILDENERQKRNTFERKEFEILGKPDDEAIQGEQNDEMEQPIPVEQMYQADDDDEVTPIAERQQQKRTTPDAAEGPVEMYGVEVMLPFGDRKEIAKVIGRKRDHDGNYIGHVDRNPLLDTSVYIAEFPNGDQVEIAHNVLAEHLWSQSDEEGNNIRLFKGIIGHRKGKNAVDKKDQFRIVNGRNVKKRTTAGWDIEVEWEDGTTSWLPMKQVKATNQVELAEYAVNNEIEDEAAFNWWVKDTLQTRKRLIKLSQRRQVKTGYKFGVQIPKTVQQALELDTLAGNKLWYNAIMKEMTKVMVAFDIKERETPPPPGHQFVNLHMVFDIKMDFTRKARLVAGGHMTEAPNSITYSSVVSRDSVRIMFLIAALNELDIWMSDVGNAYLNAQPREKIYTYAGPEFGPQDEGKMVIIVRALYGLKSSGAAWRAHFAKSLEDLGFFPCYADMDVWRRPAERKDKTPYYEYILVYVDDQLTISEDPKNITDALQAPPFNYELKGVGPPTRYLGVTIGDYMLGTYKTKYLSAEGYLEKAIPTIEERFGNLSELFRKSSCYVPAPPTYHPEVDTSCSLDEDSTCLYQSYVGILRWAVEIARIDTSHSGATMARFMAAPRSGHLTGILRMFAYLKFHLRSKIVIDPFIRDWSSKEWTQPDWKDFYPDAQEIIPDNAPEPRGKPVQINLFVDASHATCLMSRRSTTGVIIFLNGTPIKWYSKRQNTIETSTFGSEFMAARTAVELNDALRYKLRMFGVPLDGPTNGFCDNESVLKNVTRPESTLTKKHNAIAYHKVRESVASGAIRFTYESGKTNLADLLTKFLPPILHKQMCQCIFH